MQNVDLGKLTSAAVNPAPCLDRRQRDESGRPRLRAWRRLIVSKGVLAGDGSGVPVGVGSKAKERFKCLPQNYTMLSFKQL